MASETVLQQQVAQYLATQYPEVLFHSDFGSGVKLTPAQARIQQRQNAYRRGWADMFIAQGHAGRVRLGPVSTKYDENGNIKSIVQNVTLPETIKFGLFLELKKDGEKLYPGNRAKNRFKSIDGKEYRTEHLKEQADTLFKLRQRGYEAEFAIGFDKAKAIVDDYLGECKYDND